MTSAFVAGLAVLRSWRGVMAVLSLSFAAWACEASMYYLIGSWGFGLTLPIHAYTMTTAAANLGTLVPSSPGYIGVFDGIAKVVLTGLFNLDSSRALSYVVVLHAALYFPVTIWGLFYMLRESVSWGDLAALEKKEAAGEAAIPEDEGDAVTSAAPSNPAADPPPGSGAAVFRSGEEVRPGTASGNGHAAETDETRRNRR
jgi:hypothetical protein